MGALSRAASDDLLIKNFRMNPPTDFSPADG